MSLKRIKIWWMMALVAAVAVAIAPLRAWWDWHHEMLERSTRHLNAAEISERTARFHRTNAADLLGKNRAKAEAALGKSELNWFHAAELEAAGFELQLSRACRRVAAFPWLKPQYPKKKAIPLPMPDNTDQPHPQG